MGLFPECSDKRLERLVEAVFIPLFIAALIDPEHSTAVEGGVHTPYHRQVTASLPGQDPVTLSWGYTSPPNQPALGTIFIRFRQGTLQCSFVYYLAIKLMDDGLWQYEVARADGRECTPINYTRASTMIGDLARDFGKLHRS
ncbi:MAG: hypothetical protein QG626_215 [Patescibacteria group bacterium]|jgi:hypothetical protein|nr:hypothetical protein [Patescibacteria group bacterium]